jgi:hypothetical protein
MPGFYSRTLADYDSEKTTFRIRATEMNAGNMAAQLVLQAALGTAINDMTLGTLQNLRYGNETIAGYAAPVDPFAQRETRWLISYRDTVTGKVMQAELGTADLSLLDPNNRNSWDWDNADVIAFVAAFEDYAISEAGNPVEITAGIPVGRNY